MKNGTFILNADNPLKIGLPKIAKPKNQIQSARFT